MPLITNSIPVSHKVYVDRLRMFLQDTAELNRLESIKESTDLDLYQALQDTIEEINIDFGYFTQMTLESFPSWNTIKYGATLQLLMSKGILSARNTLTYQDAGGVTVQDYDKYGRYLNFYNLLLSKYMKSVTSIKTHINVESCYGGFHSEYLTTGDDY